MNCGCHGTVNAPSVVTFCALHAAAPQLRDALERSAATLADLRLLLKVKAVVGMEIDPRWPEDYLADPGHGLSYALALAIADADHALTATLPPVATP